MQAAEKGRDLLKTGADPPGRDRPGRSWEAMIHDITHQGREHAPGHQHRDREKSSSSPSAEAPVSAIPGNISRHSPYAGPARNHSDGTAAGSTEVAGVVFPSEPVPGRKVALRLPPHRVGRAAGQAEGGFPRQRSAVRPAGSVGPLRRTVKPHVRPPRCSRCHAKWIPSSSLRAPFVLSPLTQTTAAREGVRLDVVHRVPEHAGPGLDFSCRPTFTASTTASPPPSPTHATFFQCEGGAARNPGE